MQSALIHSVLIPMVLVAAMGQSAPPPAAELAGGGAVTTVPATMAVVGAQATPQMQPAEASLTKDEMINLLKTRQAELDLAQAKADRDAAEVEYEAILKLYDERLVTVDDRNRAKEAFEQAKLKHDQAKINLEKTKLEFLTDAVLISVVDARISRSQEGQVMVSVELRNDGNLKKARMAMSADARLSDADLAALLNVDNLVVSLIASADERSTAGNSDEESESLVRSVRGMIGEPYQHIVPLLQYGQSVRLDYRLLKRDVEAVTVRVEYLTRKDDHTVFLRKDESEDLPTITSAQSAQQGSLGTKIRYNLTLERLAKSEQTFSLVVLNLPAQIPFAFMDPKSDAKITQVGFTEQISKQAVDFEVSMPQKLDQQMVDQSLDLDLLVMRPEQLRILGDMRKQFGDAAIPAAELARLKASRLRLILIPKGVGKLEVLVSNLFTEVTQGEPVSFRFTVMNAGTMTLRKVTPDLDLPLDWEGGADPTDSPVIDPGEKRLFRVDLRLPDGVPVGEYTVRVKTAGYSGVESVDGPDKDFTIRIVARHNLTATALLVTLLVVLVATVSVASIKIARR